jgi:RNA polymerase-binding transcription factor DksA
MNKKDLSYFTEKLNKEKTLLEEELSTISRLNPDNSNERNATTTDMEVDSADENEVADKMEELEENKAILGQLEPQLNSVKVALAKIEGGTYGNCEICGEPIEKERLEANPSATTCVRDMKK